MLPLLEGENKTGQMRKNPVKVSNHVFGTKLDTASTEGCDLKDTVSQSIIQVNVKCM